MMIAPETILHDRQGTEQLTMIWDKTVVSRGKDSGNGVELFRQFVRKSLWLFATSVSSCPGISPRRRLR